MIKTKPSLMNNDFENPPKVICHNDEFPVAPSLNKVLRVGYGNFYKIFVSCYVHKRGEPVRFGWRNVGWK